MKIILFLLLILFNNSLIAKTINAIVIKETKVYETANTNSKIIDKIPSNTFVVISAVENVFVYVNYANPEFKSGWIEIANIKITNNKYSGTSSGYCDDTYTTYEGADFCLNIDDVDFDCTESLFDDGYDSCEVEVDVSISSNYNGNDSPSVSITCEAELDTVDSKGWTSSESDDEYTTIYGSEGWDTLDIDINVSSLFDPIVKVSLDDVECTIDNVY